jgi:iron complex outermembrane receptor protein
VPYTPTTPTVTIKPIVERNFSYKVGGEFDIGPRSMLYATYATGFKAGGFNPTRTCPTDPYKGEELDALTIGSRNRFMDNRLQVNAEAFHWKYKDQQATLIARNACGEIFQLKRNLGDATIMGGNLDVVFRLTTADTLRGSVEYTHSKFDNFSLTQLGPDPYLGFGSPCSAAAAGGGLFNINCAGQQLPRTPKWAGTVGYDHVFALESGDITFHADSQLATARWLDYGYVKNSRAKGYAQLNAELSYKAPGDRWSISAFVNNITNVAVYTGGSSVTFPASVVAPNGSPYYVTSIQPPRMYGARFRVRFGD